MKDKRITGIIVLIMLLGMTVLSTIPISAYTFKGSIGDMNMNGAEPWSRTFYSNYSKRYYMIFNYFREVVLEYNVLYSHSPYGYTFDNAHTLLNNSGGGMMDYNPVSRKMDIYLEPNGRDLHIIWVNDTDHVWYVKMEINNETGQLYPITDIQLILEGNGPTPYTKAVIDELSVVTDSEGYVFFGAEMTGAYYWIFECRFNNGTWNYEDFLNVHSMDTEWINAGHANPGNVAQGGQLLPMTDSEIIVIWWWYNVGPNLQIFGSLIYNRSTQVWANDVGTPFYESSEGDWALGAWSVADNVVAGRHVFVKQEEKDPDGQISVWAQTFNISTYTWSSKFQVGFNEAGDAGSPLFSPFASIHESGAVNFYWYKAGNATYWMNRMFPNGTLEGYQVVEDAEYNLENNQFSVIPNMHGDDKPSGIMYLDNIGTEQDNDWMYYNTEILYLESDYVLPAKHLNTTLYDENGRPFDPLGDNWIFEGEIYTFESYFIGGSLFHLTFSDGEHDIYFKFDNSTGYVYVEADRFVLGEIYTNYTLYPNGVQKVVWRYIPDINIVDIENTAVTYLIYNEATGFNASALFGISFNIYNLGGLTYYTFVGDGGRTAGGTPFQLYATNGSLSSSARADQVFRKLQHISFLVELDMDNEWDQGNGEFDIDAGVGFYEFGFDYRLNGSWVEGFKIKIYVQSADVGHHNGGNDHNWIEWSVDFYNYDPPNNSTQNIASQLIYSNHWGYEHENYVPDYHNRTSSQLWIDLWFDKTNASTTVGAQVNSMYYGNKEQGSAWWFGYGVFTPMISEYDNAKFLDDLYDENNETSNVQKYDLIRFWSMVGKVNSVDGNDETWSIRQVEDMHRELAIDRMGGIDEPTFVQTKIIDMPQTGFINAIKSAINGLSKLIWSGAFQFIKILMGAVGSLMEAIGLGEWWIAFNTMLGQLATFSLNLMEQLQIALINSALLLTQIFALISAGLGRFIGFFTNSVSAILQWYQGIIELFTGTGGIFNVDIWRSLGLGDWLILGIHLLPIWWIDRLAKAKSLGETAKSDLQFVVWIVSGLFGFLVTIIMLAVDILGMLLGLLPI